MTTQWSNKSCSLKLKLSGKGSGSTRRGYPALPRRTSPPVWPDWPPPPSVLAAFPFGRMVMVPEPDACGLAGAAAEVFFGALPLDERRRRVAPTVPGDLAAAGVLLTAGGATLSAARVRARVRTPFLDGGSAGGAVSDMSTSDGSASGRSTSAVSRSAAGPCDGCASGDWVMDAWGAVGLVLGSASEVPAFKA